MNLEINPKYKNFIDMIDGKNQLMDDNRCVCSSSEEPTESSSNPSENSSGQKNIQINNTNKQSKINKQNKLSDSDSLLSTDSGNKNKKNNQILKNNISSDESNEIKSGKSNNSAKSAKSIKSAQVKKFNKKIISDFSKNDLFKEDKKLEPESDLKIKTTNKLDSIFEKNINNKEPSESASLINTDKDSKNSKEKIWVENKKDTDSVDSEFKELFKKKINPQPEPNSKEKQMNKLNKLFERTIEKTLKSKTKDSKKDKKQPDLSALNPDDLLKKVSTDMENLLFLDSTKGFDIKNDIYKLRFDKLKANLTKFNVPQMPNLELGYLYRNYNNPKVYNTDDMVSFWIETVKKFNGSIKENELESNNKFLLACLKNFAISNKFKKKIGSHMYRAFKKTIQVYGSDLIIDVIFFIKYKL